MLTKKCAKSKITKKVKVLFRFIQLDFWLRKKALKKVN